MWPSFQLVSEMAAMLRRPPLTINLMVRATDGNHPFYERLVRDFYTAATAWHPRWRIIRRYAFGMAVCRLPETWDGYYAVIEPAARRNHKKSLRLGYRFERIEYNDHLEGIAAVLRSTDRRQGRLPDHLRKGIVAPCGDPPSTTNCHAYPYFAVFAADGRLVAFAGGLVAGETFNIEQLYGHAEAQQDGVVPMLLVEMARHVKDHFPSVIYYTYGTYFGAGATMRRFKRKFGFLPCRVLWVLDGADREGETFRQLVFQQRRADLFGDAPCSGHCFLLIDSFREARRRGKLLRMTLGIKGWMKLGLKVLRGNRFFYCIVQGGRLVNYGWLTVGLCRHYPIGAGSVVIGPVWTEPEARGQGHATRGVRYAIDSMYRRGCRDFYIDTAENNPAMRAVIAKCGFGAPASSHLRGRSIV